MQLKSLLLIFSLLLATQAYPFAMIPSKSKIHTRKQISTSYGLFYPGNNWRASSGIINRKATEHVLGREFKIRYESYSWDFLDFRLGADFQGIMDEKITYSNILFAIDFTNTLWRLYDHRIISVGTLAFSPRTRITAYDEILLGTSFKYALGLEWVYSFKTNWSFKLSFFYQYLTLNEFETTETFDPSYMALRGPQLHMGLNYIF